MARLTLCTLDLQQDVSQASSALSEVNDHQLIRENLGLEAGCECL